MATATSVLSPLQKEDAVKSRWAACLSVGTCAEISGRMPDLKDTTLASDHQREQLVQVFAALSFITFFQVFMVAPMIPHLALEFGISEQFIGLIVPAYMVPYGISTLFYGVLSDYLGRRRIMILSLSAFLLLTLLTATARTATQILFWRFATGLGAEGHRSPGNCMYWKHVSA